MNEITFGKDRYHLHLEMVEWCKDNIGPGQWTYSGLNTWKGMGDSIWIVYSMFGNTTFCFREEKHLALFILRWS